VTRYLVAGVIVVLLIGVAAAGFMVWYRQEPPPLSSSGGGVARLTGPCCPGAPPGPYEVRQADGSNALIQLVSAVEENGRPAAHIAVVLAPGDTRSLDLHEGQRQTVAGVTIQVLHIWLVPDPHNRAVDIRVSPRGP
jgi:hypothetical protein